MATLKNLSALIILLVVNVALLPRATFAIGGNPTCAKTMTADCGSQLFQIIVFARTFAPTNECCRELVTAGKDCQNQYVKLILSTHRPIKGTISDLYKRSNETWNKCVAAANSVTPPKRTY